MGHSQCQKNKNVFLLDSSLTDFGSLNSQEEPLKIHFNSLPITLRFASVLAKNINDMYTVIYGQMSDKCQTNVHESNLSHSLKEKCESGRSQHEAAVTDYEMKKLSEAHMFSVICESNTD